ncbi:MAG: hypothetical protein R2769_12255, partial [Saprospiraceae bacterium]
MANSQRPMARSPRAGSTLERWNHCPGAFDRLRHPVWLLPIGNLIAKTSSCFLLRRFRLKAGM